MNRWRPETGVAVEAVRHALALTRGGPLAGDVTVRHGRDIVTGAGLAAEEVIRERVGESLGTPVVGQERGGEPPPDGSAYWLADPICGTRNFASGIPLYCVNLALVEHGQVSCAVVGDACAGEILVAERGRGAWALREGEPRRLTARRASMTVVIDTGRGGPRSRERAAACLATAVLADRWDLRALGTSLALPYVAAGKVAGYLLFAAPAVHAAAGSLLAAEAGAVVSDVDGAPWTVASGSLIASADADLHRELLAVAAPPGGG